MPLKSSYAEFILSLSKDCAAPFDRLMVTLYYCHGEICHSELVELRTSYAAHLGHF